MKSQHYLLFVLIAAMTAGCQAKSGPSPISVVGERYVHKYGVDVPASDWDCRGKDGKIITVLSDGVVVTKNYESGILHGETTYSFPHSGTIARIESYRNGRLEKETEFYSSGTPKSEILFQSTLFGDRQLVSTWFESGTPASMEVHEKGKIAKGEYYSPENVFDSVIVDGSGVKTRRDPYGQLISHDAFVKGDLMKVTTYHPNGSPSEVIPYKDGLLEGEKITFYPSGDPKTVEEWVGGRQHGLTIAFVNGEKYLETPYVNNMKSGIEKRYVNGDLVVEEITWLGNNRHGPSKTYIGEIQKTEWYHHGQKMSKTVLK